MRQSQRRHPSRLLLAQEPRQLPSWLIFDVGRNTMNPYRVILVVDRAFGAQVQELPEGTPTWIVDSPVNCPAIRVRRGQAKEESHLVGITSFRDSPQLSAADLAASLVDQIELHHGEYSHTPPFSRLTVIGATAAPALLAKLEESGFHLLSSADSILEFSKDDGPNKAPEPTPRPVTICAAAQLAPGRVVAHL